MAKRRFISQLPVIHQTTTLQKFFNATVDQVFQPGETQSVNAFIGRKPSYFDPKKDFYKSEINADRAFYQLEPAMTTKASDGTFEDLLFYPDLINQLRFQGADTSNHERLLETDFYSWCPPINIDKLTRYRDYYWLPDGPPVMLLDLGFRDDDGNGTNDNPFYARTVSDGFQTVYPLPTAIPGMVIDYAIHRNGVPVTNEGVVDGNDDQNGTLDGNNPNGPVVDGNQDNGYTIVGNSVIFSGAWPAGDVIELWINANYKQNIIGKESYTHPVQVYGYIETQVETSNGIKTVTYGPSLVENAPPLSSGMRVAIKDNNGQRVYQVIRDDNGLLDLIDPKQTGVRADTPMYWTIEQGAENANRWSRTNHWYHKDIMFFAHENYQPIQAIRPIIEFHKNLRLVDHGFNGLPDVNARWDDSTDTPYSMIGQMDVGLMAITGGVRGIDFPPVGQSGLQTIRILVNRNSQANAEKKILTGQVQTNSMEWDGVSAVDADFSNWDMPNDEYWEYGMRLLSLEDAATVPMPERYDSVALIEEAQSWWFDGTNWVTQQWNDGGEPLFELFDTQGRMLTTLQDTTFRGSKIFAYKRGTIADKVLGIDVSRNKNGSLEFTNHINTDLITYQGGTVRGLKFYDLIEDGQDTIHSVWQPAGRSYQEQNADGFYAIPFNLQANPLNQEITTISSNEWNNHFKVIREGNDWFSGSEQFNLSLGRSILQHRSSLLKTMLLCSNSAIDLQKSIIYSEREYLRFRNKFDQALVNWANSNSIVDPQSTVLQLLTLLKTAKTPDFPFANNGIIGDYYIPATGAYLGLSALWAPEIFVENGTVMLRGHDGSLTRGTSVFDATTSQIVYSGRDTVTLALEQMIYDSANSQFKNNRPIFDLVQFTSGKFRSRDYSREEFNQVARPMFERWAAQNGYNYRKNEMYLANDPFTWNYATIRDVDGQDLPGYWRGIYRHYFDTDRPHTHPWEMFGYTSKPSFWDALYSWTDSAKRSSLIAAMESGKADPNGEADPVYARADVAKFIPVDEQGVLLNPVAAGIVIDTGLQKYSNEWVFGDGSPIEMMFWNSFSASFTIPHLSYLMKPARFIESNWVAGDEMFAFEQWFSNKSRNRAADQKSLVHNEMTGTTATRVLGVQVWISDYLRSQGQNITTAFGSKVRSLGANIAHKLGGFVDQSSVKAFTENSGLIPQEDVNIALYRSPSIREEFYGGVIVEWMGSGWRVLGYDVVNPVFKINPIKETGNKIKIKIGDDGPSSVDWHVDTYYTAGVLVHNNGTNYRCVTTHTSGRKFEQNFWTPETTGKFSPASSLIWHKEHEDFTDTVPYGTVFASRQDVADFLSGYQKFLENNGWVFDYYDNEANVIKDFRYSAQEYLYWTQSKWEPGTFIALSPAATSLKFTTDHGTVQNVEQLVHGVYSLLDRQGTAVPSSTVTVNRLDDEITIGVTQGGIFGSRVFVSEVEQALIFNNKTIFSDVIYDQLFNLRQNRIRLLALLSTEWKGRLDAPGFVITDNRLVPSFERQAEDIRYMYDIEKTINLPLRDNARHQVGYQNRSYLENLMYNDVNQFEFYQGMIQQKGAPGVFKRLMRNSELTQTRSLSFLEEWAFRKGQYGGVESRSTFEFEFNKELVLQDPQLVVAKNESLWDYFVYDVHPYGMSTPDEMAGRDSKEDTVISLYKSDDGTDSRWIVPPTGNLFEIQEVYTREKGWLPTAGYVRTSDAKWMALDLNALNTVVADSITDIALNDRVWVYKDHKGSWDIYRTVGYSTVENEIARFEAEMDGTVVTFAAPTTFKTGDVLYIDKTMQIDSEELVGAHVINWVSEDLTQVRVGVDTLNVKTYAEDEERAMAYKLESVRFQKKGKIESIGSNLGTVTVDDNGAWTYKVKNNLVQYLGAGETRTEKFSYIDHNGTTHYLPIEIIGTNDAPVISGSFNGSVKDVTTTSASGQLVVTDADINDTHTWHTYEKTTKYGTFVVTGDGKWTYTLNAGEDLVALPEDATRNEVFFVTVSDDNGAQDTATVTITIAGINDAPVIKAHDTEYQLLDTVRDISVELTATDIDDGDVLTWGNPDSGVVTGRYGTLTFTDRNTGIGTYKLYESVLDPKDMDQAVYDKLEVQVTDSNGGVATTTVTFVIGTPMTAVTNRVMMTIMTANQVVEDQTDADGNLVVTGTFEHQDSVGYPVTATILSNEQKQALGISSEYSEGELIYVDVAYEYAFQNNITSILRRWSVYQMTNGQFTRVRTQPELIRRDRVVDVKIFENRSVRTDRVLNAKPLRYGEIVSFAPVQGLIVGQADKELFYKLPYDPAYYNEGSAQNVGMQWGANQVGRLWWNLDSVRFLISETSDIMDDTEKLYRTSNWGKLAPNTSVDVYEWTRSELTPAEWQAAYDNGTDPNTYDGSVMNPDEPSWVEAQEWNAQLGRFVTFYYFWVKNRKKTPVGNDERSISAFEVARMIENPTTAGLAWVAPMDENSFIIAGVDQFLSSHSSLQFTLARNDAETPMHVEWDLLREGDERSLPTQGLWNKFITSLTGRNAWGNVIPDPERYYTDRIGFDVEHGQNIFRNLQVARKRAVQHLNEIFARTPMVETRRGLDILNGSDGKTPALHWTQSDESYFVEPLPAKTFWNEKFNDEDNLNDLSPDLVYLLKDKDQFWSVMKRDDDGLATTINLYDHVVANMAELKALEQALQSGSSTVELEVGQYVKVDDDVNVETGGFWTVWKIQAGFVFELVAHQRYDSQDIWSYVDWYEAGYESVNPPRFVFQTATDRNNALLTNPYIKFAKVNDDGRGRWMWTELRDGVWQIVAKQLGTLQISDSVWANTGALLEDTFDTVGTTTATFDAKAFAAMVVNRDMGYEFNKVLNSLREGVLTDMETNEMFFGWVHYAHTEQDFIDWCFKTSFMYVTGYSDRLRQDPIAFADLTGNLLSYINEVKPYHVKVRDFISKYGVDTELANVMALDFDKPAYYDVALGKNRILDARVPGDVAIMQSGMWKHWYNQYAFNNNVKVRKLNVTLAPLDVANIHVGETINMKIYRQDGPPVHGDYGWDVISYDGIAAYDWDETITTKDYLTRYFDPEQYGLATMDMFDWDETAGMPRVIARRINQVEDTNDTITMDVYKDVNHAIDPAIELDIVSDNRAGKWVVTAPATSNYNDIGEPSVPNGPCDVTPI